MDAATDVKCAACGVVVDEGNKARTCESCDGKKHPIWCDKCFWAEYKKATKEAPFQVRVVLKAYDRGPLHGDLLRRTYPQCLRAAKDWFEDYDIETETLLVAVEMIKEGRGKTFTSEDRAIIMRAYAIEKTPAKFHKPNKELLAEFVPLMKPYLCCKKNARALLDEFFPKIEWDQFLSEEDDKDEDEEEEDKGEEDKGEEKGKKEKAFEPASKRPKYDGANDLLGLD